MVLKITCSNCGEILELSRLYKYRYCRKCHAEYMKENRRKYSELSPIERQKANARSYVKQYVKIGKIKKMPCEICGSENSQMHHEDYSKPLEVTWLCREHHLELHQNLKECQTQYQPEYR